MVKGVKHGREAIKKILQRMHKTPFPHEEGDLMLAAVTVNEGALVKTVNSLNCVI